MRSELLSGVIIFLTLAEFSSAASASGFEDEHAFVDAVLARYIDSQGGPEILASISTFEISGTMALDSQGLTIPIYQKLQSPDKLVSVQEFPVLGSVKNVLNGKAGWEWHPIAGERPLDLTEIKELLDDSNLQRDLNLREEYESIVWGPSEIIEEIETIHLIFTDEDARVEHWYFKENGDLFQKIHTVSVGPDSEFESTERFYDFEWQDGFRFPRTIHYINPAYTAKLSIARCLINQEFDPEIFKLPDYATVELIKE